MSDSYRNAPQDIKNTAAGLIESFGGDLAMQEGAIAAALDAERLKGLPVAGYKPQSDEKVALVNRFKEMEERLLREIDALNQYTGAYANSSGPPLRLDDGTYDPADPRWAAIARTHFQEGFMALNRAVFQPQRISLPEDAS